MQSNVRELYNIDSIAAELVPAFELVWQRLTEVANDNEIKAAIGRPELPGVFSASDFISSWCIRQPDNLAELIDSGDLDRAYISTCWAQKLAARVTHCTDETTLNRILRQFRQREMVRIAWRDLAGFAELEETMSSMTCLAEACIELALEKHAQWLNIRFGDPKDENNQKVQLVVLGLGKLGGRELNYSSDIDLMFAYEGAGETDGERKINNQEYFIKLGRKIINSLDHVDANGFVFRTDMRLRPNGESGPLVLSFAAMEHYYQTHGRSWERYALIKARVVAGDQKRGAELLAMLKPFVYRKYLDFSAFDSLREMKSMIERQLRTTGSEEDIKLGRGGIREIEFLAQNHQLIRGGREIKLQTPSLYLALQGMVELGVLDPESHKHLLQAYRFLRNVEHRLQMVADRQTQKLPTEPREQLRLAHSMGAINWQKFLDVLNGHRNTVDGLFAALLAPADGDNRDPLLTALTDLWHRQLDSGAADKALSTAGFTHSEPVASLLGQFRQGSLYQAFANLERDRIDRLMPLAIKYAGEHSDAERAISAFISVVESIGHRSVYLSLLIENPIALKQLLHLCAASPWISRHIGQHPVILDELLQPMAAISGHDHQEIVAQLVIRLDQVDEDDTEARMTTLREFYHAQVLRIAAADVRCQLDSDQVQRALATLAEVILERVLNDALSRVEEKRGRAPGKVAIIAYGKFAGGELGYHSDLDIVVCFTPSTEASHSDAEYYFSRVGQRLIHLLTARTHAGILFELDMRLRPSGRSGTLVTSLKSFEDYQKKNAWTWEHQALVRARIVVGGVKMEQEFERIRRNILCQPRDSGILKSDITEMRQRMIAANCKSDEEYFDVKLDYGGIVDIEFLLQYLVLANAADHPEIVAPRNTIALINKLAEFDLIDASNAEDLKAIYRKFLRRSLDLKLMDRQVLIPRQELMKQRNQVRALWQDTFG